MANENKISDEELIEYQEAFHLYDQNSENCITSKELGKMLRIFGQNPTESELHDMIIVCDKDDDGRIDLEEFCEMMNILKRLTHGEDELLLAFKIFDKTNTGYISRDELQEVLPSLGETFTTEYVDEIFNELDTDGDGFISYDEFLMVVK